MKPPHDSIVLAHARYMLHACIIRTRVMAFGKTEQCMLAVMLACISYLLLVQYEATSSVTGYDFSDAEYYSNAARHSVRGGQTGCPTSGTSATLLVVELTYSNVPSEKQAALSDDVLDSLAKVRRYHIINKPGDLLFPCRNVPASPMETATNGHWLLMKSTTLKRRTERVKTRLGLSVYCQTNLQTKLLPLRRFS